MNPQNSYEEQRVEFGSKNWHKEQKIGKLWKRLFLSYS